MEGEILSITIANFRSIKDPVTVPLKVPNSKVIGLYGPNAAGKTNIIRAIKAMRSMVLFSSNAGYSLPYEPFCFTKERSIPTTLSADYYYDGHIFRYGFSFTGIRVCHEELAIKSEKTAKFRVLFERSERTILNPSAANYGFGSKLLMRTRQDSLLLTKAYEDNNIIASVIVEVMQKMLFASFGEGNIENEAYLLLDRYPKIRRVISKQLSIIDPSIKDIMTRKIRIPEKITRNISDDSESWRGLQENFTVDAKIIRNYNGGIFLQEISDESIGARSIIAILALLKYAEYEDKVIFIDEFGNYLHPSVTARIIEMYQRSTANRSLIVSSHQLDLYSYIGRAERIIIKKDLGTGVTRIEQKRSSDSPRRNRDDLVEARNNFGYKIGFTDDKAR